MTTACSATTQRGTPCKNSARADSQFCYAHRDFVAGVAAESAPESATDHQDADSLEKVRFEMLVQELNSLAEEIERSYPDFVPPEFSPSGMMKMIRKNLDKFTPDMQIEVLTQLRANLEGTTAQDLLDPDTWKGLWYILNYTAQAQSKEAMEKISVRLAAVPGFNVLLELKGNLEGTSPKEFLDPETWKGLFLIMNYSARATAADLQRRILGNADEDA